MLHLLVVIVTGTLIFAIFIRIIASWFRLDERYAIIRFLAYLTDPFLDPIRRIVRPAMQFDMSFLIATFLLYTLQYLITQALPAGW